MASQDLFHKPCEFIAGVTCVEQIPDSMLPEVAFAGRSNVGKSSLLNAITYKKKLARTSKSPGCTKQINFFRLDEKVMLADLPGYGYAKVSKKERSGWGKLIKDYLLGRQNLRQVFLLVDSRHGIKDSDLKIMELLDDSAVSYQVILTKTDKQTESGVKKIVDNINKIAIRYTALHPEVLLSSSVNNTGLGEIRNRITDFYKGL